MKFDIKHDLPDITKDIVEWADSVFPERTLESTIAKLIEELEELKDKPLDGWEMADVLIVMLDLCDGAGFDPAKLIYHKMQINKTRKWELKDGVFKHL